MIPFIPISFLLGCLSVSKAAQLAAAPSSLGDCLSRAKVPASLPGSSTFPKLAQPFNLRLQYLPAAVALPTTTQEVSDAVLCAARSKVKVQAKSGGHSASFSSGGQNGSMVISLEAFQNISLFGPGIAQVGGGVRLGNLATGIYNQGKRALPHGVCPGVGIGGHATHGGYSQIIRSLIQAAGKRMVTKPSLGYSSRAWGFTLDTIVGLDVVLANGTFVQATPTAYKDIFWALRGAADSIGIITRFYFQTQPAPTSIVNWVYEIPVANPKVAAAAFSHIQDFVLNASIIDDKIGMGVTPSPSSFHVSGTYRGDEAVFRAKIAPEFLRTLPAPSSTKIKTFSWIDSLADMWSSPLPQPLSGYDAHDNFYAKSILVPESSPLTSMSRPPPLITPLAPTPTNRIPGTRYPNLWFSELNLLGGPSSRVNNPSPAAADSAFSARNALWVVQHYSTVPSTADGGPKRAIEFVNGLNDALGKGYGGYLNYVDPELSASQAHGIYYSRDVYERLVRIKNAVDPEGVFWNPQAVGT
ncbi:MAG: hypothetical protein L6R40_004522 [Gallowayella cf. fulva]|nr:MAG: hypothetical protein L6R40_004522 [Xanthomendoza cf. fulva]